ncbi:uncharacterized protein HD556DRAFT_1306119 [Suillus plorans]|uniref:Uncharacterized protein n=1 Tax=Suillus plorans TaxID=116603 RepID=A0A9P7DLW1_9AGAM|nr:uncharacterized protein HD556DRAFT_1306119 [Suillus plorans]KAG1798064.1 hypothetical protein HD556DRAFT_1306119 [Suillus plorans]
MQMLILWAVLCLSISFGKKPHRRNLAPILAPILAPTCAKVSRGAVKRRIEVRLDEETCGPICISAGIWVHAGICISASVRVRESAGIHMSTAVVPGPQGRAEALTADQSDQQELSRPAAHHIFSYAQHPALVTPLQQAAAYRKVPAVVSHLAKFKLISPKLIGNTAAFCQQLQVERLRHTSLHQSLRALAVDYRIDWYKVYRKKKVMFFIELRQVLMFSYVAEAYRRLIFFTHPVQNCDGFPSSGCSTRRQDFSTVFEFICTLRVMTDTKHATIIGLTLSVTTSFVYCGPWSVVTVITMTGDLTSFILCLKVGGRATRAGGLMFLVTEDRPTAVKTKSRESGSVVVRLGL